MNLNDLISKVKKSKEFTEEEKSFLVRSISESTNFEKRGSVTESLRMSSDICNSCGRPYV